MTIKPQRIRTTALIQEQARDLRQRMTPTEHMLWAALQGRKLHGFKFRRQHPLGPYIADFYCAECRLVIEVDGSIHAFQAEADTLRSCDLVDRGFTVIRFPNDEVENNLEGVLAKILRFCKNTDNIYSKN